MSKNEKFGIYVHIPYCLQRCTYCDFATYEQSQILPSQKYIELLQKEIRIRASHLPNKKLDTLYFGGGTPSLLPAEQIESIFSTLDEVGIKVNLETEITIEINPATVSQKKLEHYLRLGVNRFSVGAQSFDDALLKSVKREHSAQQTRETLMLLKNYNLNYSFDLLFALPGQSLIQLEKDLHEVADFLPPHISPYCLTVPEGHVLSAGRPHEEAQLKMFELIQKSLMSLGYERYEISNFSQPNFYSRHNQLYWDGDSYWGVGLSSHSYFSKLGTFGSRFWNPNSIGAYEKMIHSLSLSSSILDGLPDGCTETLSAHQSLTDFCHISLRRAKGLSLHDLSQKYGDVGRSLVCGPLEDLLSRNLLYKRSSHDYALSDSGLLLSNQVFSALTFLSEEWAAAQANL